MEDTFCIEHSSHKIINGDDHRRSLFSFTCFKHQSKAIKMEKSFKAAKSFHLKTVSLEYLKKILLQRV